MAGGSLADDGCSPELAALVEHGYSDPQKASLRIRLSEVRECKSQHGVHVRHRVESDSRHVAVVLIVMCLVAGERSRIIDVDEGVAAPTRAVGLDVSNALLDATPIAACGECL